MSDKPITFSAPSAPMVRALLDGRKHQTRRIVKPLSGTAPLKPGDILVRWGPDFGGTCATFRPAYVAGDRLWVREAHALVGNVDPPWVIYRASGYDEECIRLKFTRPVPPEDTIRWRPSIHMPRWASRLTLTVTDVRVQRVQEISAEDCEREGIKISDGALVRDGYMLANRKDFSALWNSLHGPDAWARNDWVCAVTFDVRRGNIDDPPAGHGTRRAP
jgi:hypothetical protein